MAIYKRGSKFWYKFKFKGRRYRGTTGTSVERDALQIESTVKAEIYKGHFGILKKPAVPTLKEFKAQFIGEVSSRVSPGTLGFYKDNLNTLLSFPKLANCELDHIDHERISDFIQWRLAQGKAVATVNHALRTLRRALKLAAKFKHMHVAPQIQLLANENKRDFVLSPAAEAKYLEDCPPFLRTFTVLDLDTGMRLGELTKLRWPDVDWQAHTVYVSGTKTPNSRRTLPLTARALDVLQEQKKVSQCAHILSSPRWPNKPASRNGLQHAHEAVRKAAGLPLGFVLHSLRHTFCTRLAESGCDVYTLMKLAGHANLATSQRYIHNAGFSTSGAMQGFEKFTAQRRKQTVGTDVGTVSKKVRFIREKAS